MNNTFRNGKVHVCREMCETCIFRPGNLMHLDPGRRESMVNEAVRQNTAIICHSTLSGDNAVCRGFYDKHPTKTLQMAGWLDRIDFISTKGLHP